MTVTSILRNLIFVMTMIGFMQALVASPERLARDSTIINFLEEILRRLMH